MGRTAHIFCLSEALSPITHMSGTEGNEALLSREPVHVDGLGVRYVPRLSGNALRHRLVREPGARFLIDAWGLAGQLTVDAVNFLLHGGSLYESSGKENLSTIARMHQLFPLLRLLGGCLPSQVIPGSLIAGHGVLLCRENERRIAHMLPAGFDAPAGLRPAEMFVDGWQYTRGDSLRSNPGLAADADGASTMMIFSGQQVIAGACFVHSFIVRDASPLELGALLHALSLWQLANGTVGGQSARGHGRLSLSATMPTDADALIDAYVAHVHAVKDEGIAWLREQFDVRPDTPEEAERKKKALAKLKLAKGESS